MRLKIISKIRKDFKNIYLSFKNKMISNVKCIAYLFVGICGMILILVSFRVSDNWINVFSGVGTGLLTSLVVSIIINAENNAREKRKIEEQKKYLLKGIIESSIDVYEDIIERINKFIILNDDIDIKPVYKLYQEFKNFYVFSKCLKKIDINEVTEEIKNSLNQLFSFKNYKIDYFNAELKRLSKQEYFLKGILSQKECDNLISSIIIDEYMKEFDQLNDFWNVEIKDYNKCIKLLGIMLCICSKNIKTFPYAKKIAEDKEKDIKERMNELYYNEVYCNSEEYSQNQMERSKDEAEYYEEHLEELELIENQREEYENETKEDKILNDLYLCICGFSIYEIDELLNKLNSNSEKVILFLKQEKIQKELKKKRKLKKAIRNKFGKDYLYRNFDLKLEEIDNI